MFKCYYTRTVQQNLSELDFKFAVQIKGMGRAAQGESDHGEKDQQEKAFKAIRCCDICSSDDNGHYHWYFGAEGEYQHLSVREK